MIVECKEQDADLTDAVVQQVLRYNIKLDVSYLVITNGSKSFAVQLLNGEANSLDILPDWH